LFPSPEYLSDCPNDPTRLMTGAPARKPSPFPTQIMISLCFLSMMACPLKAWGSSGVVATIGKKYVVTEVSANREQITKDGTTMSLKSAGIYSLPANQVLTSPDNAVSDGKIKPPSMMAKMTLETLGSRVLQTGEKVYITKIEDKTDSKGDVLKFSLLTVNPLGVRGQPVQKKFGATVSFHFKKGYLDEAPPDDVEQAIEAVIAPDSGSDQAQSGGGPPPPAQQPSAPRQAVAAPPPPPPAAPVAPAGPPPTITIGETSTQVLQAMGMPQQMIDLGKKKTYVYKNMKVIFVDDKVSDVQ
jgi:hypothetical protein